MTETIIENCVSLEEIKQVPCMQYLIKFQKKTAQAFIEFGNKNNIMSLIYLKSLRLCIKKTNVKAQKIESFILRTYKIVLTVFYLRDKFGWV